MKPATATLLGLVVIGGATASMIVSPSDESPALEAVRFRFDNLGDPATVFVLLDDSRDLYSLDEASGTMTPILTSAAEPNLTVDYTESWSANHATYGYVYVMGVNANVSSSIETTFIMYDDDRDGVIDGHMVTQDGEEWVASGFADGDNYMD